MTIISHRELRNESSRVLREVASGASFDITNKGEIVARLIPAAHASAALPLARNATRPRAFSQIARASVTEPTSHVLDELREERA